MIKLFIKQYWAVIGLAVAIALAGMAFFYGHGHGYRQATSILEKKIHALEQLREADLRKAAEEYSRILAERLKQYSAAVTQAGVVAAQLTEERINRTHEVRALRKEIADVTQNSTHTFSPEFVRLYNRAIGVNATGTVPGASYSGGAESAARPGAATAGRFLPVTGKVTEKDILSHITYYGERCGQLEGQVRGWNTLMTIDAGENRR